MYALISCGVFQKEIERVAESLGFPFEARYLEPGLHVDFDELAEALRFELEACKCEKYDGTIVAYGQCHPKIEEIIKPYKAALIDCQNCVDAFITRRGMEEKAKGGLFFYLSPGWIECWPEIFRRLNWDREAARLQLKAFKDVMFINTLGNADDYEQQLLKFFDFTLLP